MDVRKRVGNNVRRLREKQGVSQEDLAARAALHRTYISGVERGVRNPTIVVLEKVANALGVELSALTK